MFSPVNQEGKLMYSIRELSEIAGVSARTLRYYDQIGLLKPAHTNEAGYRFYGEQEINMLQQILFYRERGMDLKSIRKILYDEEFDLAGALEEHLRDLERQKNRIDLLIDLVQRSIRSMKGEADMSDAEKFQAFKENAVKQHEDMYGAEARRKYGDEEVDEAQRKVLNMTEEVHKAMANLYISDERFQAYYDREVPGCAAFLEQAIRNKVGTEK